MAKSFDNIYINFALFSLLVLSLFTFGILLQSQNGAEVEIANNSLISQEYTNLQTSLGNMSETSQRQRELFESEQPTAVFGSLILFSVVSSGRTFTSVIVNLFNLLVKLLAVFVGLDAITISVLSSILIVSLIVGLWVLYKLGG